METLYIKEAQEYLSLLDELIEIKTKQNTTLDEVINNQILVIDKMNEINIVLNKLENLEEE